MHLIADGYDRHHSLWKIAALLTDALLNWPFCLGNMTCAPTGSAGVIFAKPLRLAPNMNQILNQRIRCLMKSMGVNSPVNSPRGRNQAVIKAR